MSNFLVESGIVTELCFDSFLSFNIDLQCVAALVSKFLGFAIILGSVLVKVPQILKITANKSVEGLAFSMFLLETIGYEICFAYAYMSGFPFSSYGENLTMTVQNFIILFLLFKYGGGVNIKFFLLCFALFALVGVLTSGILSQQILTFFQTSTIAIFSGSKIPQVLSNIKNKSVGQLAFLTCFLNFAGVVARIFTTIQEVNDTVVLTGFLVGGLLNGIILSHFWIYGEKKKGE